MWYQWHKHNKNDLNKQYLSDFHTHFVLFCSNSVEPFQQNRTWVTSTTEFSACVPGTFRRPLKQPMMSVTFSWSNMVCWFGLKVPETSLASSLFVAMPAQPVRPSLLWIASLSSAAMWEPTASLWWSLVLTSAPEQEKKCVDIYCIYIFKKLKTKSNVQLLMWNWKCHANISHILALSLFHKWFFSFSETGAQAKSKKQNSD